MHASWTKKFRNEKFHFLTNLLVIFNCAVYSFFRHEKQSLTSFFLNSQATASEQYISIILIHHKWKFQPWISSSLNENDKNVKTFTVICVFCDLQLFVVFNVAFSKKLYLKFGSETIFLSLNEIF